MSTPTHYDAIVVGAGISGIYALYELRKAGFNSVAFEAAPHPGGTWYWNSYPGARVDIESIEFSFSFDEELQKDWTWSRRYAAQPELLAYLDHVVERFDLSKDIRLSTKVVNAHYREDAGDWEVRTSDGARYFAQHVVLATGALSVPKAPRIPALGEFRGEVINTVRWPADSADFIGKRVGVVGTGATGVQIITALAPQLGDRLFAFQRTAPYVVPAHNGPLDDEFIDAVKSSYAEWRKAEHKHFGGFVAYHYGIGRSPEGRTLEASPEDRRREFQSRWDSGGLSFYSSFSDLLLDEKANHELAEFLREKVAELVAEHPQAEKFIPTAYLPLTRRLIVEDNYFESYTVHGANLVDIGDGVEWSAMENGILVNGEMVELDVLILATGFEGVIGAPNQIDIRGRTSSLKEYWGEAPSTLLGYLMNGFPNLHLVNGAGCPGALTQAFTLSEFQVQWIRDLMMYMRDMGIKTAEASAAGEKAWTTHLSDVLHATLFPRSASWYMGSNVEGRPPMSLLYLGGFPAYKRHSLEEKEADYPDVIFDADTSSVRPDPEFSL